MLTVRCTLLRGVFDGGRSDNPREAEWPPSWMRLFSAFVAVADPGRDDLLLTRLEEADPPEIHASDALFPRPRTAFVPTNAPVETAHGTLVARTNSQRMWPRAVPRDAAVWFHWPEVTLDRADREQLRALARRVPYLGRSTSPALVEVADEAPPTHGLHRLTPRSPATDTGVFTTTQSLRCASPGILAALRSAYEANTQRGETVLIYELGRVVDYGVDGLAAPGPARQGSYEQLVMFRLQSARIDGRHTARATHAFRRAVLSRAERAIPALHGHHDGTVRQCAFLGLPDVRHQHAKGHLLGLALALPELPTEDAAVVGAALGAPDEPFVVTAGPLGVLRLERLSPLDAQQRPKGLQPRRWQGPADGATSWTTALPIVLDRHLKRTSDIEAEVRRAVVNSGLPDPRSVLVDTRPFVQGGLSLTPRETLRRPEDRNVRPYRHARLEFAEPLRGPVVIGSMRHYGLGLCVPISDARRG